jgi:hypothetical protein
MLTTIDVPVPRLESPLDSILGSRVIRRLVDTQRNLGDIMTRVELDLGLCHATPPALSVEQAGCRAFAVRVAVLVLLGGSFHVGDGHAALVDGGCGACVDWCHCDNVLCGFGRGKE